MVVSGTTQTYQQIGRRESLADKIYDISPTDTPFLSMVKKGPAATAVKEEWQTDSLAAATALNVTIEGDDATYNTMSATTRLGNFCQLLDKAIIVSDTADAVKTAGRKRELAYQARKRMQEIKRDLEKSLTNNNGSNAGSAATGRVMASIEAWLTTNPSRGTSGADGGYTAAGTVTAATDGTALSQRAFTETLLKAQVLAVYQAGGQPGVCMVGPRNKQKASEFPGIAEHRVQVAGKQPSGIEIVAAADIYKSDFGNLMMVPNRFSRERTALVLDMEYWEMRALQNWATLPLARTGHAQRRLIKWEGTLCSLNEAANGAVADLTTT